jgi:hypothetical protein
MSITSITPRLTIALLACLLSSSAIFANSAANCNQTSINLKIQSDNPSVKVNTYTWAINKNVCSLSGGSYTQEQDVCDVDFNCERKAVTKQTTTYVYQDKTGKAIKVCNIVCDSKGIPQGLFWYTEGTLTYKSSQ